MRATRSMTGAGSMPVTDEAPVAAAERTATPGPQPTSTMLCGSTRRRTSGAIVCADVRVRSTAQPKNFGVYLGSLIGGS